MSNRISMLFQDALHPFRYGGERLSAVELSSELVPLTYTLSEGDLSADLIRGLCRSEGLGLRGRYGDDNWYDFVGEVNIGINLYYVIEAGRLPHLIERRRRREAAQAGGMRRPRGLPIPRSVASFLGDVNAHTLVPKAVFARYIGRVLVTWLDCGPTERTFPEVLPGPESQAHRSQPVRVADAIAVTADISLSPMEIYDAWAGEDPERDSKES